MIANLKTYVERVVNRFSANDSNARGPVPPQRVRPIVACAPKKKPARPTSAKPVPQQPAVARVISRGNNKNVYVITRPDVDENEIMRSIDADNAAGSDVPLRTVAEHGSDPYNSGIYKPKELWRRQD